MLQYITIQLIFDIDILTKVAPSSEVPHASAAQKQLYCRAIVRQGLAQGPYADGLRWIRTCNPPAARQRTFYHRAPQCSAARCDLWCRVDPKPITIFLIL